MDSMHSNDGVGLPAFGHSFHEPPLSRPSATLSPPCGERAGRGVPIWFMASIHVQILEVFATHEPYPLTPSLSSNGRRGVSVLFGRQRIHIFPPEVDLDIQLKKNLRPQLKVTRHEV